MGPRAPARGLIVAVVQLRGSFRSDTDSVLLRTAGHVASLLEGFPEMSMTVDDTDLIQLFKAGDHDAFAEIVRRYRDELVRHARRRVYDTASAEDLVQDTFMRAYRGFARLPIDSQVRPWLHRILENVCIDEANRRRRETDKVQRAGAEGPIDERLCGPEFELGLDADDAALVAVLAELPDTHREAMWLRDVDGLEYAEIAHCAETTEVNAQLA